MPVCDDAPLVGCANLARMCVIAFAWNAHPRWRLLLVGNRDELHARPSAALTRWPGSPGILAGRDLEAGGTWMGLVESGRVAVVTNVRNPAAPAGGASRGWLVTDFLRGTDSAARHAEALAAEAAGYHPFNLLLFDAAAAWFVSNAPTTRVAEITQGVHGLSNGDLDAPWPKVRRATAALRSFLADGGRQPFVDLLDAFADERTAPDGLLPDTGVGIALERRLSPVFVRDPRYGTRATTLVALERRGGGCIIERRFGADGAPAGETMLRFGAAAATDKGASA